MGANIERQDKNGQSLLHIVAKSNVIDVLEVVFN